jgi:hypothetical protein
MNVLDICSTDITEPYISVQSAQVSDSSTKTIRSDTFSFPMYIVVKKDSGMAISAAVQMVEASLLNMESMENVKVKGVITSQSIREDNTNSYAFLETELKATYGYRCK